MIRKMFKKKADLQASLLRGMTISDSRIAGVYTLFDLINMYTEKAYKMGFIVSTEALNSFVSRVNNERTINTYVPCSAVGKILEESIIIHARRYRNNEIDEKNKCIIMSQDIPVH